MQDGAQALSEALYGYLSEIDGYHMTCLKHEPTAAIHNVGQTLQVYRMFNTDEITAKHLREATDALPSWNQSTFRKNDGHRWDKLQRDITVRMERHTKQHPIATRGVMFEGLPLLIHAYKFEPDPMMKMEVIVPPYSSPTPELPLRLIALVLQCHEHIVPEYIASALPPYTHHDEKFLTISDFLSKTMPKKFHATQCLQRVSCHPSNGVGSRDTLREHTGAIASHSTHGQTQVT